MRFKNRTPKIPIPYKIVKYDLMETALLSSCDFLKLSPLPPKHTLSVHGTLLRYLCIAIILATEFSKQKKCFVTEFSFPMQTFYINYIFFNAVTRLSRHNKRYEYISIPGTSRPAVAAIHTPMSARCSHCTSFQVSIPLLASDKKSLAILPMKIIIYISWHKCSLAVLTIVT